MSPEQLDIEFRELKHSDITEEYIVAMSGLMRELSSRGLSTREDLELSADNLTTHIYTALKDGMPVGSVTLNILPGTESPKKAKIDSVVTTDSLRGYGIGSRLLDMAESKAWSSGCGLIELTSSDKREIARKIYERRGYVEKDTHFYEKRRAAR